MSSTPQNTETSAAHGSSSEPSADVPVGGDRSATPSADVRLASGDGSAILSADVRPVGGDRSVNSSVYGIAFWMCYLANTCMMIAVSVLFRYSDFVRHIGGRELELGLIVGAGMIGAIAMRAFQGVGIDRYGPRVVWLLSIALFTLSLLIHLSIVRVDGIGVYLARIMMTTSLAGAFGASITYVSLQAPPERMGEVLGTLGSSGFVGIALGPFMGDWIFGDAEISQSQVQSMFLLAAGAGVSSLVFATLGTRKSVNRAIENDETTQSSDVRSGDSRLSSLPAVLKRYHPGALLLMAIAMGLVLGMPHTFLRAYAEDIGIRQIKIFFLVYASIGFTVRMLTRRLSDRIGARPMILWGFVSATVSLFVYLLVRDQWTLALPAIPAGIAHAFLFPAVMSAGGKSFPARYRGIATTLMLAMFDIGNLIGQPMIGGIIHGARLAGWPAYPTMFFTLVVVLVCCQLYYAARTRTARKTNEACVSRAAA